jgi:hypothetical protein
MLHLLWQQAGIQITALIATINTEADRVAMHAVRSVECDGFVFADLLPV